MNLTSERLREILRDFPKTNRYHLAFSGGLDSVVLLQLLAELRDRLPGRLQALHIHHGLQPDADAWERFCRERCGQLSVAYRSLELQLSPAKGESLEALAREARYAALASAMEAGDLLLTAQHQDDQAETLLLQLLRGSGPGGLAAMPKLIRIGPGWLARPLLEFSRAELAAYARQQGLNWVEDRSNRDLRFDRNYLRHRVLPLLRQRWPAAGAAIARSARLSGELQGLVDEQAAKDLVAAQGTRPGTLSIAVMRKLSSARVRSLLRHWIRQRGGSLPGYRHLQRIERECLAGRQDASPLIHWGDREVRRFRDDLFLLKPMPPHDVALVIPWSDLQPLSLPAGLGRLVLESAQAGVSLSRWRQARVEVRFRRGGERCVPAGCKRHRSLKKLFQEWAIPPWQRDRIPLIYLDERLAAIPGRLICEPFGAEPGAAAVSPGWSAD